MSSTGNQKSREDPISRRTNSRAEPNITPSTNLTQPKPSQPPRSRKRSSEFQEREARHQETDAPFGGKRLFPTNPEEQKRKRVYHDGAPQIKFEFFKFRNRQRRVLGGGDLVHALSAFVVVVVVLFGEPLRRRTASGRDGPYASRAEDLGPPKKPNS
ncbi:hypothetical protein ACJRO7_027984 [Eucalyptus globulus]|uniref:Transmembrane protein n=1 Tax=Eucalyptus globulus TaxID=34317 RepID=A0ABD3JTT8_EUCGL